MIQLDCDESQIRQDGMPYADARVRTPGVILSFDHPTQGRLAYPADRYTTWQGNLRAIALTLAALRAIDRYGVTKKSEQYAGWKALPPSTAPALSATAAAEVIAKRSGRHAQGVLADAALARDAIRLARAKAHPDAATGSTADFQLVEEAKRVLEAHHGKSL